MNFDPSRPGDVTPADLAELLTEDPQLYGLWIPMRAATLCAEKLCRLYIAAMAHGTDLSKQPLSFASMHPEPIARAMCDCFADVFGQIPGSVQQVGYRDALPSDLVGSRWDGLDEKLLKGWAMLEFVLNQPGAGSDPSPQSSSEPPCPPA